MNFNRILMICCGLAAGLVLMSNGLAQVPPWSSHKPLPPPRHYSNGEKAMRLAKALHLPAPPNLTGAASISPDKPNIPGQVGVAMSDLQQLVAPATPAGGTPYIIFAATGSMAVQFQATAGKRYAFDCRLNAAKVYFRYNPSNFGDVSGSVDTDSENHAVFATSAMPKNDWVIMRIALTEPNSATPAVPAAWWGCEISPF